MSINLQNETHSKLDASAFMDQIRKSDPERDIISNAVNMLVKPADITFFFQPSLLDPSDR